MGLSMMIWEDWEGPSERFKLVGLKVLLKKSMSQRLLASQYGKGFVERFALSVAFGV